MTARPPDLYRTDETAWLDHTAELIRTGRTVDLDLPNLAEYLTDMANRDRREVKSRLVVLLMHLLKWQFQPEMRTPSWSVTILTQQQELLDELESGTLRRHATTVLPEAYTRAVARAVRETGLRAETFPADCPYTLDQVLTAGGDSP